jgi:hypothetical protein
MGWSFTGGWTKKDVIANLTKGWENENTKVSSVAHCTKGNILWAVMETLTKETGKVDRWILCSILGSDKGFGWGSKDMEEGMGPCYYTCPLSYLEMVPVASEGWRVKVRAYHAKMSVKLKVGDRVKLTSGCNPGEMTVTNLKPLRAVANGTTYRLPRRYIEGVVS